MEARNIFKDRKSVIVLLGLTLALIIAAVSIVFFHADFFRVFSYSYSYLYAIIGIISVILFVGKNKIVGNKLLVETGQGEAEVNIDEVIAVDCVNENNTMRLYKRFYKVGFIGFVYTMKDSSVVKIPSSGFNTRSERKSFQEISLSHPNIIFSENLKAFLGGKDISLIGTNQKSVTSLFFYAILVVMAIMIIATTYYFSYFFHPYSL